ncbi:MAG: hypothetical protein JWO59_2267 [Chloroflexi bacterium]|nr:hypothetical protein [Chloroflexota bacterium]
MAEIVLENAVLRLRFEPEQGRLIGVETVESGWPILDRPQLGLSFRLLVPLPDRRNNPVYGEQQQLTSLTLDDHGKGLTLIWDGVESAHGGRLEIRVTERVHLDDRQAVFELTIENRSPYMVENVYGSYLGNVRPADLGESFEAFIPHYAGAAEPHSWLQLHINSPEDELRVRFADLAGVDEECARHGVRALQLVGWNEGGQDRNLINQCLLYRYVISYEPYNFKGQLNDFPLTVAYGQHMDALRAKLRRYLWDGEYLGTEGARVWAGGADQHPYAVFREQAGGTRCVAIANYESARTVSVEVSLDGGIPARYRPVEDGTWRPFEGIITIPPRSAVVVLET